MAIYRGSTEITPGNLYVGDQEVKEVYVGDVKVWNSSVADHRFAYGTITNVGDVFEINADGGGIVKVVSGGQVFDVATDGNVTHIDLPSVEFEVWYTHPIEWINFKGHYAVSLATITIDDISTLTSLKDLFSGVTTFEGNSAIQFLQSTSHITDMSGMFSYTMGITALPESLSFESVENMNSFAVNSRLNYIVIDAPNALYFNSAFSNYQPITDSIYVYAPNGAEWASAFTNLKGGGTVEIHTKSGVGKAANMFNEAGQSNNYVCVTGYINTMRYADTYNMFKDTYMTRPTESEQSVLETGGTYQIESCGDPHTYRFAYGTVDGSMILTIKAEHILGLTVLAGGQTYNPPDDGTVWSATLGTEIFEVFYEDITSTDAYISFASADNIESGLATAMIDNIAVFRNLNYLFSKCNNLAGSTYITFTRSTSHITNMSYMFNEAGGLVEFPTGLDMSSVENLDYFAAGSSIVSGSINAPNATSLVYAFANLTTQGTTISVTATAGIDWTDAFINFGTYSVLTLEMGVGLQVKTLRMFQGAGGDRAYACIKGYLDTTNATDTYKMFDGAYLTAPDSDQQQTLLDGGVYDQSSC